MSDSTGKKLFIGVDEAGYGPNLGPLLICGTAWLAPKTMTEQAFCNAFSSVFLPRPLRTACKHVPLGDSKKLYRPGSGLSSLEAGLLAMTNLLHPQILVPSGSNLHVLVQTTHIAPTGSQQATSDMASDPLPWYEGLEQISIPGEISTDEIQRLSLLARDELARHDIHLIDMRSIIVTEPQFNRGVDALQSKGQLLSKTTLGLVADLLTEHPGYSAQIFCDRQGGRKNYLPILLDAMPDCWFVETQASNQRSSYRSELAPMHGELNSGDSTHEIHFSVGGDSFPPTALASMLAKYLRERLMGAFNAFWARHLPTLKPTAGYPLDAKRFRSQIQSTAEKLNLPPELWWRSR